MYLVDSLPAPYYEEREAAELAKRVSRLREQAAQAQHLAFLAAQNNAQHSSQACPPHPTSARPTSTGVLGNIFQGFARASSQSPSLSLGREKCDTGGTNTPVSTPPAKVMTQSEIESLMAEKRRDADIVGFRAW